MPYIKIISDDNLSVEEKIRAPIPNLYGGTWNARYSVLESLLIARRIDRIKNDSLKFQLTNWGKKVENYDQNEGFFMDGKKAWLDYIFRNPMKDIPGHKNNI